MQTASQQLERCLGKTGSTGKKHLLHKVILNTWYVFHESIICYYVNAGNARLA